LSNLPNEGGYRLLQFGRPIGFPLFKLNHIYHIKEAGQRQLPSKDILEQNTCSLRQ
jgi:hypothetical protein